MDPDRQKVLQHLAEAERHVSQATIRIQRQREIVEALKRDGHDVSNASELLETYEKTLALLVADRDRFRLELAGEFVPSDAPSSQ